MEKIRSFLNEDIYTGDITVESVFSKDTLGSGQFIAKSDGIIAGLFVVQMVYDALGGRASFSTEFKDGDEVKKGTVIGKAKGPIVDLLKGERIALNLMQRMSGIATMTARAIKRLDDPTIRVCDTRKTMPGLRIFDKYAVKVGGGKNHRFGLYDAVMLKDNHISYAGSISNAVEMVRENQGHMVKIEVEIESHEQLLEAIEANCDVIMFDNQKPEVIKEWKKEVPNHIAVEASGGIELSTIHRFKGCGADYLSMGELTHSTRAFDISFVDEVSNKAK